mmetsp:Transcript_59633/g.81489  ORF Transcript_59633/g.81489 Transcript_59633/m.81489 type:complete len:147 (-) Transcript_59633:278-718(-)
MYRAVLTAKEKLRKFKEFPFYRRCVFLTLEFHDDNDAVATKIKFQPVETASRKRHKAPQVLNFMRSIGSDDFPDGYIDEVETELTKCINPPGVPNPKFKVALVDAAIVAAKSWAKEAKTTSKIVGKIVPNPKQAKTTAKGAKPERA